MSPIKCRIGGVSSLAAAAERNGQGDSSMRVTSATIHQSADNETVDDSDDSATAG